MCGSKHFKCSVLLACSKVDYFAQAVYDGGRGRAEGGAEERM